MNTQWQTIRAQAAHARAQYAMVLGHEPPFPLPVDELAEDLYQLTAYTDPTLDAVINGRLDPVIGTIRLNPRLDPLRRRFVLAHELGHFILHGPAGGIVEEDETTLDERANGDPRLNRSSVVTYNTRERHEQDANLFALELLVPAVQVWQTIQAPGWSIESLAASFGVSPDALRTQLINLCCLEPLVEIPAPLSTPTATLHLDPEQQAAVVAPLPALVVAGPGTGKTRSIVGKYLSLIEQGTDPAQILALTFSNQAAEEMRQRIVGTLGTTHASLAGRVEISTFHSWALNFLKSVGPHISLPLDFRLLPPGDLFILLRRHLASLPLQRYKNLWQPGKHLPDLVGAISRCKDELCPPAEYQRLAATEAQRLRAVVEREQAGKTTKKAQEARNGAIEQGERLQEVGRVYEAYEALLRREGVLDYGDLILRAVEALRLPDVAAEVHARYRYVLVDEFQDINYASGILVSLLDGGRGCVWAVGDPWQSIYRFRGASPATLADFPSLYPAATQCSISSNYRSIQTILDASHHLMQPDPLAAHRPRQQAQRRNTTRRVQVVEWVVPEREDEGNAIAHDILQRVRPRQHPPCLRPPRGASRRRRGKPSPKRRVHYRDHAILCRKHAHAFRIVSALEAHGIPVDWLGDIYDYPEAKDLLAIAALVGANDGGAVLRALTIPDHALSEAEMIRLVQLADKQHLPLEQAIQAPEVLAHLSPTTQATLQTLREMLTTLAQAADAWEVLTTYLFSHSQVMRERIQRAARQEYQARRELAVLGEVLLMARTFVNQNAPEGKDAAAFVRYVKLLIEGGESPKAKPIASGADAVRVMTVHAAKGLEFPIVYLPTLEKGEFPTGERRTSVPPLPTMLHGELPTILQEERYLLYVAMTRARDKLILLRSHRDGKGQRSPLLPGGPTGDEAPWLVREVNPSGNCPTGAQAVRLTRPAILRHPIPASSLESYERCPRRYLYQYGYQLYDDLSPALRMHQAIRSGGQALVQSYLAGTLPATEAEVEAWIHHLFTAHDLVEVPYAQDYWERTRPHLRHLWAALRSGELTPAQVNHYTTLPLTQGELSLRVDLVQATAGSPQWVRLLTSQEKQDDHLSLMVGLYVLAYAAHHQQAAHVAIRYSATGRVRPVNLNETMLESRRLRAEGVLNGIAKGIWEPHRGFDCAACPYNLICPL